MTRACQMLYLAVFSVLYHHLQSLGHVVSLNDR
jgi:hypothetical protein